MSSRGHSIPPVVVKKTRAPSQPRTEARKISGVARKSPLNDSGRPPLGNDGTVEVAPRSSSSGFQKPAPKTSDIDSLTTGMKKVRLNLTTKAQRDAREQAKLAQKPTITNASTKPIEVQPAAPVIAAAGPTEPDAPLQPEAASGSSQPSEQEPFTPSTPQPSLPTYFRTHIQEASQTPSTPVTRSNQLAPSRPSSSSSGPDLFIPYQPEGPTQNTALQQEPLRWLPPNTATPASVRRADLPVFTSTSTIPFSPNPNLGQSPRKPIERPTPSKPHGSSLWQVPETPRQKQ